jgi:outer membrane lipoprotein carrier protein
MHKSIIFCLALLPLPGLAAGTAQLRQFLAATPQAHGSFVQTVIAREGGKPRESSGLFAFARPGKFRWSYEKPYKQLLVSDGRKLWTYDPDLNQVSIGVVGRLLGASPAALLAGESLDENFTLSDAGSRDGLEFVEALPKAKESGFERMRIGLRGNLPVRMEIVDAFGQTSILTLGQIETGRPLPAETFRFVPPAGADVVEQR